MSAASRKPGSGPERQGLGITYRQAGLGGLIGAARSNVTRCDTLSLTGEAPDAAAFAKRLHLISEIYYADGVPLKTMVRANPGILLLKNGTVLGKWHYHSMPKYDDLVKKYFQQ